jgi:hypothetical protein
VAEPTRKGVSVYRQYRDHAREFGIRIAVIGNKVTGEDDLLFLKEEVGDDLLTHLVHSPYVRAAEQGREEGELESHNRHALNVLRATVDACPRDWATLHGHAVEFHRARPPWPEPAVPPCCSPLLFPLLFPCCTPPSTHRQDKHLHVSRRLPEAPRRSRER